MLNYVNINAKDIWNKATVTKFINKMIEINIIGKFQNNLKLFKFYIRLDYEPSDNVKKA